MAAALNWPRRAASTSSRVKRSLCQMPTSGSLIEAELIDAAALLDCALATDGEPLESDPDPQAMSVNAVASRSAKARMILYFITRPPPENGRSEGNRRRS